MPLKKTIHILADNALPNLEALFPVPFALTQYQSNEEVPFHLTNNAFDILLCRSTLQVSAALLEGSSIQCVATASSGSDHIDHAYCQQHNILTLSAKGCNREAVADYIIATLSALHHRGIPTGKTVGIIGMGYVGKAVSERLRLADFSVYGYDPVRALTDTTFQSCDISTLKQCSMVCIHANLHDTPPFPSRHLVNHAFLQDLKPGVILINAARGGLVDEQALLERSEDIIYCTDVYEGEPNPNPEILGMATLCTPHIAGHSIEAKQRAVQHISQILHTQYDLPSPNRPPFPTDIPLPNLERLNAHQPSFTKQILEIYNPEIDTKYLKAAADKRHTFLARRKAHHFRHDFSCYALEPVQRLLA